MKTLDELKAEFGSNAEERKLKQKLDFARLTDTEFLLLTSLGKNEIILFLTPQAEKYIKARQSGTLTTEAPELDLNEPERGMSPERAARIIGGSIANPRAR